MQPNEQANVTISLNQKLARLSPSQSQCCIFHVHNKLRNINENAYEPEIVAIGPYYHGKKTLQMMEEHKLRYLQLLLKQRNDNLDRYVNAMRSLEEKARECYAEAESITLNRHEFVEMLVLDGCFIVELLRKYNMNFLRDKNDVIFKMDWMIYWLQRDLMLFENQLPFFVLCKLFDLIEVPNQHSRFIYLALNFFHDIFPGPGQIIEDNARGISSSNCMAVHLLDLIHKNWLPTSLATMNYPREELFSTIKNGEYWRLIKSATELKAAGLKFEKIEGAKSLFDINFKNGVLQIPQLTIEDRSESFFRNLLVQEQYFCGDTRLNFVTSYVKFLDCLINSPSDVEILRSCGIIDNWLGDDKVVSDIFNKIGDSIIVWYDDFHYAETFNRVNIYCNRRINGWLAKLKHNYLNSPWAVLSIFAAFVLLVLTLTQTAFGIVSYKESGYGTAAANCTV
ncbi:hypothetical protein ACH5RR_031821 [Cinchona calisaya]|uniref:Uncharacterized protein n=1 Tax=Cinchona calisaya TaxID=153742 RepID=A0ABD2YKC8_9GENT